MRANCYMIEFARYLSQFSIFQSLRSQVLRKSPQSKRKCVSESACPEAPRQTATADVCGRPPVLELLFLKDPKEHNKTREALMKCYKDDLVKVTK